MKIFKYPLMLASQQYVVMPSDAQILDIQFQDGFLCLWAKVDDKTSFRCNRVIEIFGTGHEIPDEFAGTHIATVQMGGYVWHFFDCGARS